MKSGEKYRKDVKKVLSLINHGSKVNTKKGLISIFDTIDFDIGSRDACKVLIDLSVEFKQHLTIKNIYDLVNEEHWLNPPPPGYDDDRPIAEIRLKNSFEDFCVAVVAELKKENLDGKIEVIIDIKNGIYKSNTPDKKYAFRIRNKKLKRLEIIRFLHKNNTPQTTGMIARHTKQQPSTVDKEIKQINKLCEKNAEIFDLIVHVNTGGYELNRDKYTITFQP